MLGGVNMTFYDRQKKDFYSWKKEIHTKESNCNTRIHPSKPEDALPIEGFPGYLVTPRGEVWSEISHKYLKPSEDANNYLKVNLKNSEGVYKWKTLHILTATAFLPRPENAQIVNHLSGNKHDCAITNLEWDTYSGNIQHAYNTGLNKNLKPVIRINPDGTETEYQSIKKAVTDTAHTSRAGITQVCNNKRTSHGSYHWKWKV